MSDNQDRTSQTTLWRPIQTAPVGVPILVWSAEEGYDVAEYEGREKDSTRDPVTVYPTHWMPLPQAPEPT